MSILQIQDSTFTKSYTLHEALIKASENATSGAGAFAFVSKPGIKLILEDEALLELFDNGNFHFVAGIDSITNESALGYLHDLSEAHANLTVQAFHHDTNRSLFHPKFCWFKNRTGGMLVIGSGNFTIGGLRTNREAFSTIPLSKAAMREIEEYWTLWITENERFLKPVNDAQVNARARLNTRVFIPRPVAAPFPATPAVPPIVVEEMEFDEELDGWSFGQDDSVLIAEIPKSGPRWKQANFHKNIFESFFGAIPGDNTQRVLFRHVLHGGVLEEIENRPSVSVKSHNYRFELEAAVGDYPTAGRPIAMFARVAQRTFLYVLTMPGGQLNTILENHLNTKFPARTTRMLCDVVEANEILPILRNSPLSNFVI
jgi:hypothetical protein